MIFYQSKSTDPYYNLALEGFLFNKIKAGEELFMLWQNDNTIVVGKNQNTGEEINSDFVNENNIKVARRMTGGGAVYHDLGNVNFTFIVGESDATAFKFSEFLQPLTDVLQDMGIDAKFNGRNDVTIDEKKICGNSQRVDKKKILHHGCILLSGDLSVVSKALNADPSKFESKSTKSVRSRVTNINNETKNPVSVEEFIKLLKNKVGESIELEPLVLTDEELEEIERLRKEKYSTWEWNYGESPKFDFKKKKRFETGTVSVSMNVERGAVISDIKFFGDFFGEDDKEGLETLLRGRTLKEVPKLLKSIDVGKYITGVSAEDLMNLMDIKALEK